MLKNDKPLESPFLYFCGGNPECQCTPGCIFWDGESTSCCRTSRIEYAKNQEKFRKQLLDGTFPHDDEWEKDDGIYVEVKI